MILLFFSFISPVDGEQEIKPVKDKYIITKNTALYDGFESTDTLQIDLIDLRNNIESNSESGIKDLEIIISDFIPTSKGRLSNADNILQSQNIILGKVNNENNGLETKTEKGKETQFIKLKSDLTQFTITTNSTEKDTVTYSGKIYLKNESISIPIDVDIVMEHDPFELIIFNFIGVGMGIGVAIVITRNKCNEQLKKIGINVEFNNSKGPWIMVVLTTIVGVPSSLLVNNLFIGSVMWDAVISLGIGFLILVSLLKEKEDAAINDNLKIEFELPNNNQEIDKKKVLEVKLNESHPLKGWFEVGEDQRISIRKE